MKTRKQDRGLFFDDPLSTIHYLLPLTKAAETRG